MDSEGGYNVFTAPSVHIRGVVIRAKPVQLTDVGPVSNKSVVKATIAPVVMATSGSVLRTSQTDNSLPLTSLKSVNLCDTPLSDLEADLTPPTGLSKMAAGPGPLHLLARLVIV